MKYTLQQLQDMAFKELQKNQLKYENQIMKTYHDALVQIQGQMKILYDRYATNGELSLADLARYNRYTSMEKQIMDILSPAVKDSIKEIKHLLPEQYQESYYHYAWAIDNATGLRLNWGELNPAHIAKLFDIGDVKNIYYSEALKNYLPDAQKNIRKALMANLSMGKSFDMMAKDLRRALNITNYQGLRIARTESMTSINAGTDYAYQVAQQKGIEGKVYWDATLDMRTRPTHGQMDGAYKTGEGWILPDGTLTPGPGGYAAPYPGFEGLPAEERINCRCHIRYDIDGFSPTLRRTRDQGVIPYQTYDQWSKEQRLMAPESSTQIFSNSEFSDKNSAAKIKVNESFTKPLPDKFKKELAKRYDQSKIDEFEKVYGEAFSAEDKDLEKMSGKSIKFASLEEVRKINSPVSYCDTVSGTIVMSESNDNIYHAAHELTHALDYNKVGAFRNSQYLKTVDSDVNKLAKSFESTIQETCDELENGPENRKIVKKWMDNYTIESSKWLDGTINIRVSLSGDGAQSEPLSDMLSSVSIRNPERKDGGKLNFSMNIPGHSPSYWNSSKQRGVFEGVRSSEMSADLMSILGDRSPENKESRDYIKKAFPEAVKMFAKLFGVPVD